jgi:anti-anti-sigma factor
VGIEQAPVTGLLKMTRTWDLLTETSGYPLLPSSVASGSAVDGLLTLAEPVAGVAIACLNGRLDVDRVVNMDVETFTSALGDGDCVLDLSGLRFVDSTGLRLLYHLQRHFNSRERKLILCGMQPRGRQLLDITRLTDQFCQAKNREQALGLLAARQRETGGPKFTQDYRASASRLDRVLQKLYVVAYRAEMAVNFLIRPRVDGAYVAVWHGDRVLLILNSYKSRYTLPCGKVRSGEDPLEAARRELREEVGLDLESGAFHQSFTTVDHSEFKEDHIHLYETRLEQLGKIRLDGREVVWAGFRTPAEAVALPLFPPVKTYLLDRMSRVLPNPV